MFQQEHSFHHHTQSNSVVHPFYPMATGDSFCGLQHAEDEVHIFKPKTTVGNAIKNFITLSEDPTDEQVINPLAPEFSFKFEHTMYIKCE